MPVVYCSVDSCDSKRGSGLSFFRCPKDEPRCQAWRNQLGFTGSHRYASITPNKCYDTIKICSLHFPDDSFMTPLKQRLNYNAVPTLFLSRATTISADNDSGMVSEEVQRIAVKVASTQTDRTQAHASSQTNKRITLDKCCQTSMKISNGTPRKMQLRSEIKTLKREVSQSKKKIELGVTLDDVKRFLDSNYSPESCAFLKSQLSLLNKAPKGFI